MDVRGEIDRILSFLERFMEDYGYGGFVLGISGGVDSAAVAGLLVRLVPPGRIRALILPERDSNPESVEHAKLVCETFGLDCEVRNITPILKKLGIYSLQPPATFVPYKVKKEYALKKWAQKGGEMAYELDIEEKGDEEFRKGVAYYRAKHRVRMCVLYMEAELRGYAVAGTTNRTEWLTGLYVKWGDDATDVEPLLHLYKSEVFELARALGVPKEVVEKPPSPDLIPGLTDEMAFGMSYMELDGILRAIEDGGDLSKFEERKVERARRLLQLGKRRNVRMVSLERK